MTAGWAGERAASRAAFSAADFETWFAPAGVGRFMADHWRRRALNGRLGAAAFAALLDQIGPLDPATMAARARGGVEGWLANAHTTHSVLPLDAGSVEKALHIGATLYFIDVDLSPVTQAVAQTIGVAARQVTASLFLTPAGGGASWHFDANENFTVQLTGAKQWAVGLQPCVPDAEVGYVVGLDPPAALNGRLGTLDPEPALHVTLEPGSLLYVPRGTLHRTGSGLQSWSLNLANWPEQAP